MVRATIIGATGRMGQALVRAAPHVPQVQICAAVASRSSAHLGRDVAELAGLPALGVPIGSELDTALAGSDVAIDFSQPHATAATLAACRKARVPLLLGTTGHGADAAEALEAAAREIPVLVAPNTSIGVTLLVELVRRAAEALPAEFDVEILEAHHRMKKDAPSGTALALGEAAAAGRGRALAQVRASDPARAGARRPGEIGFAVVRGGDIVGEHTVLFAGSGEQLVLGHRATDRAIFARGALLAAAWLVARPAGRFSMRDFVLRNSGT